MDDSTLQNAMRQFCASRARKIAISLWKEARRMDAPAVQRTVNVALRHLKNAGIADARVVSMPADGKTSVGGWLMPVSWSVRDARLEIDHASSGTIALADYQTVPQSLAVYSPSTPHEDWARGEAISVALPAGQSEWTPEALASVGKKLRGRFLFLLSGSCSPRFNEWAARQGALAILTICPGTIRTASRFLNYAVPFAADRPCIPCFSLAPAAAARLQRILRLEPHAPLRARVRAQREAGILPVLTGSVGRGDPAVYVCAHIDEPGALDNASGCAVAIEALRVMQHLTTSRVVPPQIRAVRFFFSTEVRGIQAWVNRQRHPLPLLGGINLDMIGEDSAREPVPIRICQGFRHRPHFFPQLLNQAVKMANRLVGRMPTEPRFNWVSDSLLTSHDLIGHVSIEQKTGRTYHTSADTPRMLAPRTLAWSGAAVVAFLVRATREDNRMLLRLARRTQGAAQKALAQGTETSVVAARRALAEVRTIEPALQMPVIFTGWRTPDEFYRAGVRRTTGCWPAVEQRETLRSLVRDLGSGLRARAAHSVSAHPEASRMVPQALFQGYLSFEDQLSARAVADLKRETGLIPAWSTDAWAWMLASCFRGKQTLAEIVADLQALGIPVDIERAVQLTRYLEKIGRVRLRPILTGRDFRRTFLAAGVKRGGILMVHASLSRFGYAQDGSATVVQALLDVLGPRGTLAMPTHSNSVLGDAPYNPRTSPSLVGAVTEYFRRQPGVLRSLHPTHSVAAFGPAARTLTESHRPPLAPLAREGFWGRLYDLDGDILLLCPIRNATVFHVGETWEELPQALLVAHSVDAAGHRTVHVLPNAPWHVNHFEALMARPLLRKKVMRTTALGDDRIVFGPARAMSDISVAVNRRRPWASLGSNGACSCWYCQALRAGLAARGIVCPR